MKKIEFKNGQTVIYKPYEVPYEMIVKIADYPYMGPGTHDDQVFYGLVKPGSKPNQKPTTVTTGKCIVGSKLYEPWTEEKRKNFFA
jgi:hypothetical protein